jgi:hypothetical protein
MKIKTNLRAGSGGASGVGGNSVDSGKFKADPVPPPPPPSTYTRCAGY